VQLTEVRLVQPQSRISACWIFPSYYVSFIHYIANLSDPSRDGSLQHLWWGLKKMSNAENCTTGPRADRTESRKTLMPPKKAPESRARHWVFTVNCVTERTAHDLKLLERQAEHWSWQLEQAPSTGHLHYQGFISFAAQLRFSVVKKMLPTAALYMAVAPAAAYRYCLKDDTCADPSTRSACGCPPPEPKEGLKQNRWEKFRDFSKDHSWNECVNQWPDLVKNVGAMRIIYEQKITIDRSMAKEVFCFYGDTGVGKSLTVSKILEGKEYFRLCNGKWFDGYAYEPVLWIDDMQPKQFTRAFFLQLLDFGAVRAEVKGGTCVVLAKTIYVTSNYHPTDWFEKGEAVMRRMTVYHVTQSEVGLDQRQGNIIPAVALKNQAKLLGFLQAPAASSAASAPLKSEEELAGDGDSDATQISSPQCSTPGGPREEADFESQQLEKLRHFSSLLAKDVSVNADYVGGSPDRLGRGFDVDDPRDGGRMSSDARLPGGKGGRSAAEGKRSKQRVSPPPTGAVGKWTGGDVGLKRQGAFWNIEDSQVLPPLEIDTQDE